MSKFVNNTSKLLCEHFIEKYKECEKKDHCQEITMVIPYYNNSYHKQELLKCVEKIDKNFKVNAPSNDLTRMYFIATPPPTNE